MPNKVLFWKNMIKEMTMTIFTSNIIVSIEDPKVLIILLASENLEIISPDVLVEKKLNGSFNTWL